MKKIEVKLPTGEIREIEPSSESYIYRSVTDGNRLSLEWTEGKYIDYPVGLTAHVDGYDYTLYYPVEVRKVNTELLEYRATLHGREEELKMTKLKDVGSDTPLLSFVLTGKPTDFVRFVRRSMGEGWSVGQVIEGSERTLAFRHESCHDALARIAEEYHTEWHVDGTAISLSRLEVGREQPVALSYGMGKGFRSGVGRRSDGEETPIGRLFVDGGKRNIDPSKYGALTLRLPKGATYEYRGVTYRTDPTGSYITGASGSRTEGSYDGTDVYPRRVGRVTRVEVTKEGLVDIIDSTIPETLNYNDYRIGGEKAVIVFLSGMLTGREIEIEQTAKALSGYLHEERRFRLVSSEQDGQQMPGGSYMPKEGDTYAVYGISLPEEYVRTAEEELFHEACRYLSEEERERFRFDGQLDPVFAHREWGRIGGLIVPGGFVHFSDKQFYPRGSDIRIVSVRHPIGQPWAAELTLSGGPTSTGYLGSRLGRLEAEAILRRREEERRSRLQRQDYAQAVEAIGMISRAVKEVEGYTARIKPSVVETMGLLIGSEAGHFDFVEAVGSTKSVPFVPVVEAEAVVLPSSVLRHQTLGVKALTNKHRAEDFRYWTLPEYTSPALSDGTESYYIYAKVEREGSMGVFLLSREPISMEKVTGYYHLLVGTVSSVVDGSRAYNRLYGYSMLTPGALTVGAIESGNGNMRIDLETGQIIVKHLRIGPPDASKDLQTELDDTVTKSELDGVVSAQEEHDIQAAKAALDAAKKAYDDAVKRAKELDSEIQVGGRNLAVMSRMIPGYLYGESKKGNPGDKDYKVIQYKDFVYDPTYYEWDGATPLTYRIKSVPKGRTGMPIIHYHDKDKVFIGWAFDWSYKSPGYTKTLTPKPETAYIRIGFVTPEAVTKIERGTVATDWTPAPEDVQSEIDAAKEQATKAQQSTDSLKGYVDGAFRDGIVDGAEAMAIKTYINDVDAQWQSALGAYEKVYQNPLLTGAAKTTLLDCKTTLAGKCDDLTQYIATAISDGRATPAEVDGVNTRYNVYKGALRDFQKALKSAEEAIRDAGKTTGGRNLLLNTGKEERRYGGYIVYTLATPISEPGKYVLSFDCEVIRQPIGNRFYVIFGYRTNLQTDFVIDYVKGTTHFEKVLDVTRLPLNSLPSQAIDIYIYPNSGYENPAKTPDCGEMIIRNVKLERGTVATDWTPAPEDVQAEIDAINANPPRISAGDTWEVYDPKAGKYIDTGRTSKGDNGKAPIIKDGNWWEWDAKAGKYTDTGVRAIGVTGAKGAKGDKGDKGDGLDIIDTRNDNQPPSWYREKYALTTVREFKRLSPIEIPSKWWSGYYCTLETTVRWADTSGGRVEQSTTLDNGVQLRRVGTADDTTWEPWINVSAEVAAVRQGLANTDTLVSALEKAQSKLDQGILTKADTKDIQYLLDSLKNGDTQVAGGLVLSNDIILSDPNSKDVTATISGTQTQGANVMRLGISYTCDEDKKATVERAGAKWGINLSSILTGLESDSDRIRKLDELGFTIVGGQSLAWPKWEICKATDAKEGGEATALANDGTGHIGELYFWGESIGFGATDKRYMQIGGTARSEYDMVNASTVIRKFDISGGTVRKSGTFVLDRFDSRYSNREIKYTANLSAWAEARAYRVPDNGGWDPNDHRYHKPEYEEFVRTESSATVQLRLELRRGGSTIKTVTSPQVSVSVSAQGGQFGINEEIPQSALYAEDRKSQDVTITISPSDVREQDTVTLSLVTTIRRYCYHHQGNNEIDRYASATASAGSIINYLPYDTSQPMVSVTKDRAAFFYGRSKYVLLNYLESCVLKVVGNILLQGNLTVKGDIKQEGGGFLAGGVISTSGNMQRWVGKKLKVSKRSTGKYRITHNIGHTNYCIQAIPINDTDWNAFVISGTETTYDVEIGVQWNGGWRNGAIHFAIFAQ